MPEGYAGKARYALGALLAPLGLEPAFEGEPRIIYGAASSGATPMRSVVDSSDGLHGDDDGLTRKAGRIVRLSFSPAAPEFFRERRPLTSSEASSFIFEGESWPVAFRDEQGAPDLVASAFLYLSGWHEAAAPERDEHGRVSFEATLPGTLGAASRPVVDAYRRALASQLALAGIDLRPRRWRGKAWALCPTHDVDYLRKWRPGIVYRELVQYLLLNQRREPASRRIGRFRAVLRQIAGGDPYRKAFRRMIDEVVHRGGTATYFVKAGASDPHDVPYSLTGRFMRRQFVELRNRAFEIALHPSYRAVEDEDRIRRERDALGKASSSQSVSVRQHYLRFDPVRTPRMHADAGFEIDSTIGFADRPGYRRGTCLPYRLYDLENDRALDVWEMPLIIMESALFNRQGLSADEAVDTTRSALATCRRFGGACVVLWHNTLWDEVDCSGWGEHFTQTLDAAMRDDALIASLASALEGWQ